MVVASNPVHFWALKYFCSIRNVFEVNSETAVEELELAVDGGHADVFTLNISALF